MDEFDFEDDMSDEEFDLLVAETVEASGGDLALSTLVDRMLDMAALPVPSRVDLASPSAPRVELAGVGSAAALVDLNAGIRTLTREQRQVAAWRAREDERQRIEDPEGWSARTYAGIAQTSDLAWAAYRGAETTALVVQDETVADEQLPPWEFARRYGIGW